jgi:hypothetical protein
MSNIFLKGSVVVCHVMVRRHKGKCVVRCEDNYTKLSNIIDFQCVSNSTLLAEEFMS